MTEEPDFADIIKEHGHGDTNRQLTKVLREVLLACEETNAEGVITLQLKVSADKSKGMAEIEPKISVKTPMSPLLSGSYFHDKGALHSENPRQAKLPLRTIAPLPFNDRNRDKE